MDELLILLRPRALATANKVLRQTEDAEDAVQDAFVKVWRGMGDFEGRAAFTTWVHRVVVNASLDLLRKKQSRPRLSENDIDTTISDALIDNVETPERKTLRAESGRVVRSVLGKLAPVHREAIELRELDDLSYQEIAESCQVPVGTVMSRLHHARKRLSDELREHLSGDILLCAA